MPAEEYQIPKLNRNQVAESFFSSPKEERIRLFRCIHTAAQDVGGFPQEGFKLLKGDSLVH